jgi:hypothetical protein
VQVLQATRLFIRRGDSVRVQRSADSPYEITIEGPGAVRRAVVFSNEDELLNFQRELEAQLLHDGFALASAITDRRTTPDRREQQRGGRNRRTDDGASVH